MHKDPYNVSIVIINYNKFDLTVQCIRSIYEKTLAKVEIIIVDNGSTECQPERIFEIFPQVRLIINTENKGFARGCNDGIIHASAEYILLLNNDTILLNDAVSIVYHFLRQNPDIAFATCAILNTDGIPQHNCQPFPYKWKFLLEKSRLHKLLPFTLRGKILWGPYFSYDCVAYPDWIWGTFMMFNRQLLNIFPKNKLPETFWMYCEDLEWCWLAHKAGYRNAFIPSARILHFNKPHIPNSQTYRLIQNNFTLFKRKYMK